MSIGLRLEWVQSNGLPASEPKTYYSQKETKMSQANVFEPVKSMKKTSRISLSNVAVAASTLALVVIGVLTVRLAAASPVPTARERAIQAEAERWSGLAQHYAEIGAARERALDAETARWTGLAGYYGAQAAHRQRVNAADAARWTALAEWYAEQSAQSEASRTADAARYTGLALMAYARTGDTKAQPTCISPELAAQLPTIGDDSWRAEVGTCGE